MAKRNRYSLVLKITLVLSIILLCAVGIRIYEDVLADNVNSDGSGYLYIYTQSDFDQNMQRIKQSKALKQPDALSRLLRVTGYSSMIKPGKYRIQKGMNNLQLMRLLVSGRQTPFNVVFKGGMRLGDVCGFWSNQLEVDSAQLYVALQEANWLDSLELTPQQAIALFIPDTYNMYWNTSEDLLLKRMRDAYEQFWNEERYRNAEALGLTKGEVATLASIVQKETNKKDEMPVIAGVYYNRLKRNMRLQADPTVIYAANDPHIRRVSGAMLSNSSPFNTYVHMGLPPGPICVPEASSIDAVLRMPRHSYLYFCAKEDFSGYHRFASSFNEHQKNARKFQLALDKRGIK